MKYSVIVLACVLAVATAQYNNGLFNQNKPFRFQQTQNNFYRPIVSSTPFPTRFVSSTPVPLALAPSRSYFSASSDLAASVKAELPAQPEAIPSAAVEITAVPARSALPTPTESIATWSATAAPEAAEVVSAVRVAPEAPIVPAAAVITQIASSPSVTTWSASSDVAPSAKIASWSSSATQGVAPSASIATWSASATPEVAPASSAISVTPLVAQVSPVFPTAKIAAVPTTRYISDARGAETLRFTNQINSNGAYDYAYETNNGIVAQAQGFPRSFYSGEEAVAPIVSQGSFGWISPEGQDFAITYVADENGYQPRGSAIPQAPAIPPLIARALEYMARLRSTQ